MSKPKLRHIAITVPDPGRRRSSTCALRHEESRRDRLEERARVYLSDGVVNLALLNYKTKEAAGKRAAISSACTTSASG